MALALNFFIIILIELPIIAIFFKKKKRREAVGMGLLINIISWAVVHIIFFTMNTTVYVGGKDVGWYLLELLIIVGETIAFNRLLHLKWKKSIVLSLIANILSFTATQIVPEIDSFPAKQNIIQSK